MGALHLLMNYVLVKFAKSTFFFLLRWYVFKNEHNHGQNVPGQQIIEHLAAARKRQRRIGQN